MATFDYQSFLEYDPQTVADGDATLYAGPSALLTGLPATHTNRGDWSYTGDGSRGINHGDLNAADDRAFHHKAQQGKGTLLIYAADQTRLMKLDVNVYAHSGAPDEREESALWTLHNLKRSYHRYFGPPHNRHYWRNMGLREGLTLSYPRMYYELEPIVEEAAGGKLSGSHILYHTNVLETGTATEAFLLFTEDAFGTAQADVSNDTELASATPEQLNITDSNRPLVWLKLPVGDVVSSVLKLTNDSLGQHARVLATNSVHFAIDVLPAGREAAAVAALNQDLIDIGVRGHNYKDNRKLADWQYYMDLGSVYGAVGVTQLATGTLNFPRNTSMASMFTLPDTGKFYFEVDMPTTGNKYASLSFIEAKTDFHYGDFNGTIYGGAAYYNGDFVNYPHGTSTVRVLVDMDALNVTFLMDEVDVSNGGNCSSQLIKGRVYNVVFGINDNGSGSGELRLRFTDADFLFTKPEGYTAVSTLLPQASSV